VRAALVVMLACSAVAHADEPNPHREVARAVLERHCGACHRSDQPTAQAKALAVFTLNDLDWSAKMTPLQLKDALDRLRGNGEVKPSEADDFQKFYDAELKRRRASPR
jgi:hypothetical protein